MEDSNSQQPQSHQFHGVGLDYNERFTKWWSVARQSEKPPTPYEFLENFGASSKDVDLFLERKIIGNCKLGLLGNAGPGAIDYFCHHYGGGSFSDAGDYALQELLRDKNHKFFRSENGHVEDLPTEQDLLSLADTTNPERWALCIPFCLVGNYSGPFLQSMFRKVPKYIRLDFSHSNVYRCIGKPGLRQELDHDCVLGIQELLPNLKSVTLAGRWKEEAYVECVALLLETTRLDHLCLKVPTTQEDEDELGPFFYSLSPPSGDVVCGIQKLTVDTSYPTYDIDTESACVGAVSLGLDCLQRLPQLRVLDIKCYSVPLRYAAERIVPLLETHETKLETLSLVAQESMITTNAVLDILEALKNNSSVTKFDYVEAFGGGPMNDKALHVYEEKLLQILQDSNTTVTTAELALDSESAYVMQGKLRSQIECILELNQHGRAVARDAETTIAEFVDLLHPNSIPDPEYCSVCECDNRETESDDQSQIDEDGLDGICFCDNRETESVDLSYFRINYGLLREMPGMWSHHVCSASSAGEGGSGRKRKRSHG